jgi:hypothetical protein
MSDALMPMAELAELLGLSSRQLGGEMRKFETKLHGVRVNDGGVTITYYDRDEALAWAELWRKYQAVERGVRATPHAKPHARAKAIHGQVASSRTPAPFKPLRLPTTLQRNFERASQAQTTLYTPDGIGNGVERQFGFGRGS